MGKFFILPLRKDMAIEVEPGLARASGRFNGGGKMREK